MAAHIGADNLDATAQTRSVRASNAGSSTGTISSQGNSANAASNQVSPDANEQSAVDATVGERRGSQRPEATNDGLLVRWFGSPFMPCFLGLAALRVWLQVNQFGGYAQSDNGVITILSNLTYGLTFLIAAAMAWRKPPTPRTEHAIAFIAAALMLVAPLLMLAGLAPNAGAVAAAGALLVGVAGAFGGGMWACAYTRLPLKPALMYAFASLALGSLGGLAVSFLPEGSRYIASLFMPALSLLCFERTRAYTGDIPLGEPAGNSHGAAPLAANASGAQTAPTNENRETASTQTPGRNADAAPMRFGKAVSHPYDNEPKLSLVLIIGGIAVFGLALGLSRGFPAGSPVPFGLPVRFVHQLGVVAISAGFMWWIGAKGRHISFSLLWRLEIVIAATGAFILMVLPGAATEIAVAIVNIADTLMLCVLFITAQDVARHSSLHPFVIFGGAWAARVLSRNLGRTVVFALSPMTQSESAVLGVIVFALSLSMVCLLTDNLPRTRKLFIYDDESGEAAASRTASGPAAYETKSEGSTAANVAVASSDEQVREWLRTKHGLTAREIDVALLIARGRSKTFIADELFISENTVRTHSKNVYTKLGIHSREELISLFENRTHL